LDQNFWAGLIAIPGFEIEPIYQENVGRARIPAAARNWAVGWIFCIDAIRGLNRECSPLPRDNLEHLLATGLRRPPLHREAALVPVLLDDTSSLPTRRHQAGGLSSSDISVDRSQAMDCDSGSMCSRIS
jgi:hypothetical protein